MIIKTSVPATPVRQSQPAVPEAPEKPECEPVLLIHGTNANQKAAHPDWWHVGSDFCREINSLLQQRKSKARCWAHLSTTQRSQPFAWTGANSELDRFTAGKALALHVARLEDDPEITRYHLVGHSHGGNVILHALRSLQFPPRKLGAVIFMGTPVLHFRHPEDFDVRWIALPLYLAALAACGWAFTQWGKNVYLILATLTILAALLAEIFLVRRRAGRAEGELYGSGRPSAFVFRGDEAMDSLQMAEKVVNRPSPFIRQFTESETKPFAFDPTSPPDEDFFSRTTQIATDAGAYRLIDKILHPPSLSNILAKLEKPTPVALYPGRHIAAPKTVHAPFLTSPTVPETGPLAVLEASLPQAKGFRYFVVAVLGVMAFLPALVMVLAESIFNGLKGILLVLQRGFLWAVLKSSPPIVSLLIRVAALGADKGRFLRLDSLPPGVRVAEGITPELKKELETIYGALGKNAGQLILPALLNADVFSIKSRVAHSLSGLAIVHSHYYGSHEVQSKIAQLICESAVPRPRQFSFSGSGLFPGLFKNTG